MIEIEEAIRELAVNSRGAEIPKPEAKEPFRIKGMGVRRKQIALIYTIPSHSPKQKSYAKGVTFLEFERAYLELIQSGILTRSWFNAELADCAKEGSCNFTTIGGIFEMLGAAKYLKRGVYAATSQV